MPTITRPRKPSKKTASKVKLPTRDPLDRTMARASALVWPDAVHPRPFADRTKNAKIKKRLQKVIGAFTRELKRRPDAWSLDSLPYSDRFEYFIRKAFGNFTEHAHAPEVFLTVYLTVLRLRKTGELAPPKPKAKPKVKVKVKVKAARKRPKAPTSTAPLTLVA